MKVRVGKRVDEKADIVVVPSRRSGRPPRVIRGVSRTDLREVLGVVLKEIFDEKPNTPG